MDLWHHSMLKIHLRKMKLARERFPESLLTSERIAVHGYLIKTNCFVLCLTVIFGSQSTSSSCAPCVNFLRGKRFGSGRGFVGENGQFLGRWAVDLCIFDVDLSIVVLILVLVT